MMWKLIIEILMIVLFTYGGGAVFIQMFERSLVDSLGLFSSIEYATIIAVLNSLPGVTGGKLYAIAVFSLIAWVGVV